MNHLQKTRRITTALAAFSAASLLAVGCSSGAGGGALGSGESLTIITSQAPWNPAYEKVISAFEEDTGIKVDVRAYSNDDVRTQILNDIQSGSGTYDVYQINEPDVAEFNINGWLQPFTDIDPDYELDPEIFTYGNLPYWNAEEKTFKEGGELTNVQLMGNMQLVVYRKDLYEKLGLSVPTTWEEVIENGKAIQEAQDVPYGFVARWQGVPGSSSTTYDFMPYMYSQGADWVVDEGKDWTPSVNTPEAIKAATLFQEAAKLGPKDTKALGQAEAIALMQAGDSGQLQVVAAAANSMQDEANSNVVGEVGYAPLPVTPDGHPAAISGVWSLGIPADLDEERSETALKYVDWVTSQKGMKVFVDNGGIPTRSDAYEVEDATPEQKEYLDAVAESAENSIGQFRMEFSKEFYDITETIIANIAAGDVTPEEGMNEMQEKLTKVVEESGYPMGE
ncbi:MAG: extracellular solute-binding protein [Canibacter sp.]